MTSGSGNASGRPPSRLLFATEPSDNPQETFARLRAEGTRNVRRQLRDFSLQNYPASVDSPPRMMTLEPGEVRIRFQRLDELAEAMLYLATVFTHDLDGFAALYEPPPAPIIEEKGTREDANG